MKQLLVGNGVDDKVCIGRSILNVNFLRADDKTVQVSVHDGSTHSPEFRNQLGINHKFLTPKLKGKIT